MGTIIDGKDIAGTILERLEEEIVDLKDNGIFPKLSVLLVGNNPSSIVYVRNKESTARRLGVEVEVARYEESVGEDELLYKISELNADQNVHGILVQLPLPSQINTKKITNAISPEKDVDGFHPINLGRLLAGEDGFKPCTPAGIMELIRSTKVDIKGKRAVVIGRSLIVGKPTALLLLEQHATVTICHSRTEGLPEIVKASDIVVAAIGSPMFIKGDWIKRGSIVIDVGITKLEDGKIVGDLEFERAKDVASFITPVPGGVGPMTIAMLMKNVVKAASNLRTRRGES